MDSHKKNCKTMECLADVCERVNTEWKYVGMTTRPLTSAKETSSGVICYKLELNALK